MNDEEVVRAAVPDVITDGSGHIRIPFVLGGGENWYDSWREARMRNQRVQAYEASLTPASGVEHPATPNTPASQVVRPELPALEQWLKDVPKATDEIGRRCLVERDTWRRLGETNQDYAERLHNLVIANRRQLIDALSSVSSLQAQVQRMGRCLSFFSGVIKCGEPWTDTCETELRAALAAAPETL